MAPTPSATPDLAKVAPRRRRRPIWIAVAVLMVAAGSLLAWWVVGNLRDTSSVVAVQTDIPRGSLITAEDLTTAQVIPDPALITVPASDLAQVVGRRAAVDLHAGGLLSPDSTADTVTPPAGFSVVGLALEPGQLPLTELRVGDKVRIVSTPKDQDDPPAQDPALILEATIVDTTTLVDSTATQVDVQIPSSRAATLAALTATNRVALILDNSGN